MKKFVRYEEASMGTNNFTAAVQEACELTAQEGYDLQTWMIVLNRGAGTDPDRLRRASVILSGVADLLRKNAVNSNG